MVPLQQGADNQLCLERCYFSRCLMKPSPARPTPKSTRVPGSGMKIPSVGADTPIPSGRMKVANVTSEVDVMVMPEPAEEWRQVTFILLAALH